MSNDDTIFDCGECPSSGGCKSQCMKAHFADNETTQVRCNDCNHTFWATDSQLSSIGHPQFGMTCPHCNGESFS